jgi:signal transduction histidine kinase
MPGVEAIIWLHASAVALRGAPRRTAEMRIVPKLTLALVGGMCVVLGINGYFRVRRETEAFEAERLRVPSAIAFVDAGQLRQVVTSLVTNAVQASEAAKKVDAGTSFSVFLPRGGEP